MRNPDKKSFNILLDPATFVQLTELAMQQEVSRGAVVRAAIRYHHQHLKHAQESGQGRQGGLLEVIECEKVSPQLTAKPDDTE